MILRFDLPNTGFFNSPTWHPRLPWPSADRVMGRLKSILSNDRVRRVLCAIGALYIRFVHATGRWTTVGDEVPRKFWDDGLPFILCFWHGRLLMTPYCWRRSVPIHMLISQHRDGQIIAWTVGHFGIDTVAGSSSRGGAAALRSMVGLMRGGACVGITPDGPRGPRMRASDGIAAVARLSGVPVIPATFGISRRRPLSTWDRFVVALPFSRGVFLWGEPIDVPRDADAERLECARQEIEEALNRLTDDADRMTGYVSVEPAPETREAAA